MMIERLKMLAGVAAIGAFASACTPGVVYDQTAQGAAVGAALGCVGIVALDARWAATNAEDCVRGAVIGGVVGGVVGLYLDEQERLLSGSLAGSGAYIIRTGKQELKVVLPSELSFQSGSASLTSGARSALDKVSASLASYPQSIVHIDGHTDNRGSASANMSLSIRRANNVKSYLSRNGVNGSRMIARGFGESQPQASNSTASGRAENRRVEIRINAR